MYGILLRLDSARQQRVGTDQLKQLLSAKTFSKISKGRSALNASVAVTSPFAPTLVRPSFYPEYFRATDIRTLFWKIKLFDGLHNLAKIWIDENSRVVFEFADTPAADQIEKLNEVLKAYGHYQFTEPSVSGKKVTYTVHMNGEYYEDPAELK